MREGTGISSERVSHDDEEKIAECDHETDAEADRCFLAVGRNAKWDRDECKSNARKGCGKAFVEFHQRFEVFFPFGFGKHVEEVRESVGAEAAVGLGFLEKLIELEREDAFAHHDTLLNFAEIVRLCGITLLKTGIKEPKQKPRVLDVGRENPFAGIDHFCGVLVIIHFKNENVFEMVALLASDINSAVGKLIHDFIRAEKGYGIIGCDIDDGAGHRLLSPRSHIHIDPKAHHREGNCDSEDRQADPGNTHAIGF